MNINFWLKNTGIFVSGGLLVLLLTYSSNKEQKIVESDPDLDQKIQIVDGFTKAPLPGVNFQISSDGSILTGETNEDGYIPILRKEAITDEFFVSLWKDGYQTIDRKVISIDFNASYLHQIRMKQRGKKDNEFP